MLRPRIIPSLLMTEGRLVKTRNFKDPKYVGDPINAVRIFNEKEADELAVFDISATRNGQGPNFRLIEDIAAQCRMPLCYGGGISTAEEARRIIDFGVEKIAVNSAAFAQPSLVAEIATRVGAQSVVVVLDATEVGPGKYTAVSRESTFAKGTDIAAMAARFAGEGAGEIVINNIDRDGTMAGYDLALVRQVRDSIDLPITVLGGAGSLDDIRDLVATFGIIGAAAGSLFVLKGKLRAVLISYPRREEMRFGAG